MAATLLAAAPYPRIRCLPDRFGLVDVTGLTVLVKLLPMWQTSESWLSFSDMWKALLKICWPEHHKVYYVNASEKVENIAFPIRMLLRSPRTTTLMYNFDNFDKTAAVGIRAISELSVIVVTRGPHSTILFQHHTVVITSSHKLRTAGNNLRKSCSHSF